jgi:branched-chain amino acid transport system permease protein
MITLTYFFPLFIYASLALCILLSYRAAKIINLSLGSIFTLGGYFSIFSPLISPIFGALIGFLLHVCTKKMDLARASLFSLGLAIIIEEVLRIIFRVEYILLKSEIIVLFNFKLILEHFIAFLVSMTFLILFLIFDLINSLSRIKLKIVEEDLENAEIYGINIEKVRVIILVISSALFCSLGSLYLAGRIINPTIGWIYLIFSFLIAAIANAFKEKAYISILPISFLVWLLSLLI